MTNKQKAEATIERLAQLGVRHFCVCSGARNVPLLEALAKREDLETHSFFSENSAGFFALGHIKSSGQGVCVITTSGTAVAELLPAVVEAHYLRHPLVVLSADRPQSYKGSGAPQAIEQEGIFSSYADRDWPQKLSGPLHINVSFTEPLLEDSIQIEDQTYVYKPISRPLVIVSQLNRGEANRVLPFLQSLRCPLVIEAHSNLSRELKDHPYRIFSHEGFVETLVNQFDGVLRIGGVPTLRFWRDLEKIKLPVVSFSSQGFSGLSYIKEKALSLDRLPQFLLEHPLSWNVQDLVKIKDKNNLWLSSLKKLVRQFPLSEQSGFFKISKSLKLQQNLFVSNSSPIRHFDFALGEEFDCNNFYSSRGTNGIDGQLSLAMGLLNSGEPLLAIVGDLTALYDMSGLWPLKTFLKNKRERFTLLVVNNQGGELFEKVFKNKSLQAKTNEFLKVSHGLNFSSLAQFWGLEYLQTDSIQNLPGGHLIEWCPNNEQTRLFEAELKKI